MKEISRSSSISGMVLSVFFTVFLITMIIHGSQLMVMFNVFSPAALERAIPYVLLIGAMGFITNACMFVWAKWNIPVCIVNVIYHLVWIAVTIRILLWPDLLSTEFATIIDALLYNAQILMVTHGEIILLILAVIVIISIFDVIGGVLHTLKGLRKEQ